MTVHLVTIGEVGPGDVNWPLGPVSHAPFHPARIVGLIESIADTALLWDPSLPLPDGQLVTELLDGPADAWHAGLLLGQGSRPRLLDRVNPLWMLNRDPDITVQATSWRLSLRALLVRGEVLRQLGGPSREFDSLSGAALDLGLRWITQGALVRHEPRLLTADAVPDLPPSPADELRIVARHHGRGWGAWAVARDVQTRAASLRSLPTAIRVLRSTTRRPDSTYRPPPTPAAPAAPPTVTAVVPTIDRYPFVETVLRQLAAQTHPPDEVVVIDQTPADHRRHDLADLAPTLPIRVIEQAEPGQCTSRNAGILSTSGDAILFIDDDDELPPDLIEQHLRRLRPGIDASSGGVDDATAGPPPPGFRHRRAADVFPTNNTMLRRAALARSGLFDPAFDRGARADHDLGMRLYLSGALLVYDPQPELFHHHAPSGGLRTHGARTVTRSGSRRTIRQRHLPGMTERYLAMRYYTTSQRRDARVVYALSTLGGAGPLHRRALRSALQLLRLPTTFRQLDNTEAAAVDHLRRRPPIPTLE